MSTDSINQDQFEDRLNAEGMGVGKLAVGMAAMPLLAMGGPAVMAGAGMHSIMGGEGGPSIEPSRSGGGRAPEAAASEAPEAAASGESAAASTAGALPPPIVP
jgi:hypothetical protein